MRFLTEARDSLLRIGDITEFTKDDVELLYMMLEKEIMDNLSIYANSKVTPKLKKEIQSKLTEYLKPFPFNIQSLKIRHEGEGLKFDFTFETNE